MKKYLWYSIFIFAIAMNSCDNDNILSSSPKETQMEEQHLLVDLQNYNKDLLTRAETRGAGDWILKTCAIAGADIIGAWGGAQIGGTIGSVGGSVGTIVGGSIISLVCGTGASYLAYKGCSIVKPGINTGPITSEIAYIDPGYIYLATLNISPEDRLNEIREANISTTFPEGFEGIERIGIDHNLALEGLFMEDSANNDHTQPNPVDSATLNFFNSPEFIIQYQALQNQILTAMTEIENLDIEQYFSDSDNQNISLTAQNVMTLFMELYTQYPAGLEDIDQIVNFYLQKIDNTNALTMDEKEILYSGLAVAAYSPRFWSAKFENEQLERGDPLGEN